MTETISIPRSLLEELYEHFAKIEEILATLEELMNKEGIKRVEKSLEEYRKGDYIVAKSPEEIREALTKD